MSYTSKEKSCKFFIDQEPSPGYLIFSTIWLITIALYLAMARSIWSFEHRQRRMFLEGMLPSEMTLTSSTNDWIRLNESNLNRTSFLIIFRFRSYCLFGIRLEIGRVFKQTINILSFCLFIEKATKIKFCSICNY